MMQFATNLNPTILFDHAKRLKILLTSFNKYKEEWGPIFNKCIERYPNVRLIRWLSKAQVDPDPLIKPLHQIVKKLVEHDIFLDDFERKSNLLKKELTLPYCDLILGVFKKNGELKDLIKWRAQMDDDFSARMTSILTLENTLFFIHTIETLIFSKSKFDFIQWEISQLEDKWE